MTKKGTLILKDEEGDLIPVELVPDDAQKEIERAMKLKRKAKALEDEAKILTEEAKSISLPILVAFEIKSYRKTGTGTFFKKVSRGSNINAKKLKESLLLKGVEGDEAADIISTSSNTWEKEYVEFKEDK